MPPDAIEVSERDVTCIRCATRFSATITSVAGREIAPNICFGCAETEDRQRDGSSAHAVHQALDRIGVNVRRHGASTLASFETASGTGPVSAAREFIAAVRAGGQWSPVRGLMLCGKTGVGKTHLAVGIIRDAILGGMPSSRIIFDRASRLITEIQDTYGTGATAKVMERRERALLWVLDDLGAEKATSDSLRILHDLIDAREGHPNVITSNLTPPEIGQRFSDVDGWARIASRLGARNYRIVRVAGLDRRFEVA